MKKDNRVFLQDILDSISRIEEYTKDVKFTDFESSRFMQDAVIRNIEILGEAMKRLTPDFIAQHPELPDHEAISLRNFLIHEYDEVNLEMLWDTIHRDLPQLRTQVINII